MFYLETTLGIGIFNEQVTESSPKTIGVRTIGVRVKFPETYNWDQSKIKFPEGAIGVRVKFAEARLRNLRAAFGKRE